MRHATLLDRRTVLRGGAVVAAAALGAWPRMASALGRIETGEGELTVVSDGHLSLPMSFSFPEVDKTELEAILAGHGLPADANNPDCNVTFLRRGDRLAIFDVGSGPNFMPSAGKLLENLGESGIDPSEVTDVIFTHAHPDHIWGLVDDFDELVFPDAAYHMGSAEWDFWRAPGTLDAMPEERKTFVVGAQNRMAFIEDRIELFEPGAEILPGVEAVGTPGHTPGHMSFMIHGGAEPVFITGDAITHVAISFARPDWPSGSDQDKELGARTRVALMDRLASERARIVGFHLPHPGIGFVERERGAYRYAAG